MVGSPEPEHHRVTAPEVRTPAPRSKKRRSATELDGSTTPARRKRGSKRPKGEPPQWSTQSETVIMAVLGDLQDDVMTGPVGVAAPAGSSTPPPARSCSNKVYVQRAHGFSQTTREKMLCLGPAPEEGLAGRDTEATPLGTAIAVQERLLPFYMLCHGVLGGLAIAMLLTSYSCGSVADEAARFMMTLSPVVHVTGSLFYFLAAVCTVSVFDRFDLSNMDCAHVADAVKYQGVGLVTVGVYVFTLVSTLVCMQWDDGITLYHRNGSHWSSDQELVAELGAWHALNACRCVGGMLGWVLVVATPGRDMLRDHLAAMFQYQAAPRQS